MLNKHFIYSYINITGLPHGQQIPEIRKIQEKQRKITKVEKWGFLKKIRNIFLKVIKFCQFKFTKFLLV